MRTILFYAAVAAGLSIGVHSLLAQAPGQGAAQPSPGAHASRYGIAVIDVSYIFKNHRRFTAAMEGMKKQVEAAENGLREERKRVQQMEEQLKQFQVGTPDYKLLDEKITEAKADFNLKATKIRKEFLDQEAKVYYQAYLEVNDAVKGFAQRNNIGLVLRFNGDPVDPNLRDDVLRAINKPVVYENGIDITPDILSQINRSAQPAGGNPVSQRPAVPGRPN